MALSGRHIELYLSTYFSPNTHLLGEAVALFFIERYAHELRSAPRWKRIGRELVLRESSGRYAPTDSLFRTIDLLPRLRAGFTFARKRTC